MEKVIDDIEARVRKTGFGIYSGFDDVPPIFNRKRWTGALMDRAMKNEEFKVRLFRFVDLLPSLKSNESVVSLLREYFDGDSEMPALLRSGIGVLPMRGIVPWIVGPIVRKGIESVARQFIAGKDPEDLARILLKMQSDGTSFSLDILGEVVVSDMEALKYTERYLALLEFIHHTMPGARPDVSVKISSFYSQLDPVDWDGSILRIKHGLRPVLRKAKKLGISITFDMEHYYYKGLTIAAFKSIIEEDEFKDLPGVGIAIQAYLADSEDDIAGLINWTRQRNRVIGIRLVKGAYWDYEVVINRQRGWPVPVYLRKDQTDACFEKLAKALFENKDIIRPVIATHNLRSVSYAIACADSAKTFRKEYEFQVLYGMAEPLRKSLQEHGYQVRVYTPAGELIPGMAYLVRRLLENTSNESFLRRSYGRDIPFSDLMKPPRVRQEVRTIERAAPGFRNEPVLDFSIAENRNRMSQALVEVRSNMGGRLPLVIGDREFMTDAEIVSRNPSKPDEVIGKVSSSRTKDADAAISAALTARYPWRKTSPEKRANYLFRAAEEMRKKRFELAALEVLEAGKTWKDADGDVAEAIDYLEYYGREMLRLGKPRILDGYPGEQNEYTYHSKGIGVVISPWNFPLAIATGMTSAAIVTGNCVIFKPSGLSPVIGYRLVQTFRSVGLPAGVLQFLPGPGKEVGEYLVSHPSIDFIAFTGSREVGLRITQLASEIKQGQRAVKRVVAEMGGKNAIIADETADLDEAVKGIIESAFGYQGQKCSACSRLIIVGQIYQKLCDRLTQAAASLRIGNPEDPGNFIGPVIDQSALNKIRAYGDIGRTEGKAIFEKKVSGEGYFAGPLIIADADPESRIATEEIFGPVLAVLRAKDIDDAVRIANKSVYALTGGLFSRSPANIEKVKREFLVGNLYINRKITGALVGRQPFGGFGMSGIGSKAGGPDYLLQFMNPVSTSENTIRRGFAPFEQA